MDTHQEPDWTPLTIAGPSHVLRWRTATKYGQVSAPKREIARWHGKRGQKLGTDFFLAEEFAQQDAPALLLVPDFRLGNATLHEHSPEAENRVDKDLITPENDRRMRDEALSWLHEIRRNNPSCRFLFWSLAGREAANRQAGKYQDSGEYQHPLWNLAAVEAEFGEQVISLAELVTRPEVHLLFVDDSLHPSWVGLELLRRIVEEPNTPATQLMEEICAVATKPVIRYPRPTVLTGDSVWVKRLRQQMENGLLGLSPDVVLSRPKDFHQHCDRDLVYVSEYDQQDVTEFPPDLLQRLETVATGDHSAHIFLWETRARMAKREPAEVSNGINDLALPEEVRPYVLTEPSPTDRYIHRQHVESSAAVHPTIDGVIKVVEITGGFIGREPLTM